MKVMPPITSSEINYSFNEIYICHGYIIYKVEIIFLQSLLHYQHEAIRKVPRRLQ
jgi:hypothetical protein